MKMQVTALSALIIASLITEADFLCSTTAEILNLNNGRFKINQRGAYRKNSIIVAACIKGYSLKGDRILMCDGNNWVVRANKVKPSCHEPKCPEPPSIENGFSYYKNDRNQRTKGSRVFYDCLEEFRLVGRSSLVCHRRSLTWRGTRPRCQAKTKCQDPGDIIFGTKTIGNLIEGSQVSFNCEDDSELVGPQTLTCLPSGKWDKEKPACKPRISCKVPNSDEVPNAVILTEESGAKFVLPGGDLLIECQSGFRISGITYLECLEDGTWDSEFAKCDAVDGCNKLASIENGGVMDDQIVNETKSLGTIVNFYCDEDYHLSGSSWIQCSFDEFEGLAWSSSLPTCDAISCSDHDPPNNGIKYPSGPYYIGSTVSYSCYGGYKLVGSKNRTCKSNGAWSGVLTTCDAGNTVCPDPGIPINGMRIGNRFNADNEVSFTCKTGHFMRGNSTRMCQSNGYWTGTEVICRGKNEYDDISRASARILTKIDTMKLISDKRANITEGTNRTATNITETGRSLDLNNPGGLNLVFIFDSSGSVGKQGFETAKKFAITLVQHIGISKNGVRAAAITFSSEAMINFFTREYLTTEEVVEQINLIKYNPGDTATNPALMKARTEVIPDATRSRPTSSTAIFLITDGRANIRGRPQKEVDLIIDEFRPVIYAIGVGSSILEDELASIAYPKGENDERNYMKVGSFAKMDEMLQFLINGTIDYSACGLLQRKIKPKNVDKLADEEQGNRRKRSLRIRIIGGSTVTKHWPWMAALFYGNKNIGFKRLQCGASLIANEWVLTAAHCIKFRSRQNKVLQYTLANIRVHLGITNFKDPDFSSLVIATPELLLIHPDYDLSKYNNDIALVKLRDPVRYNALMRPVCLPPSVNNIPDDSSLYRTGELAIVTGWGHTKVRQKLEPLGFNDLKQSAFLQKLSLPIEDRDICNKSIQGERAKGIFTDSMICVGTGKGGQDSCSTDSGGPLHQQLEDPNGDGIYYTQIGIVSWGIGCGLEGEYGFYVNVAKFIPWIESKTGRKF